MVPGERLELSHPKIHDFESCASSNSAIRAKLKDFKIASANFQIFALRSAPSLRLVDHATNRFVRGYSSAHSSAFERYDFRPKIGFIKSFF
jgi:hypothetical protein